MTDYLVMLNGLKGLQDSFINNWVGPLFIMAVAVFAVIFIKNRQIRELAIFLVVAAIVGLLIFFGDDLFGSGGSLTDSANELIKEVNMIIPRHTPRL